jgi:hypothetical protein
MMKTLRIPPHTINNVRIREISLDEVRRTVEEPARIGVGYDFRKIYMRKYYDSVLDEEMLMRVVVEESDTELVVVTAYKTSKIAKYMKGDET